MRLALGAPVNTLVELFEKTEHAYADKIAAVAGERRVTYRELGALVRALSASLAHRWGVTRGDVIAVLAPNSIEFIVSYFAIVRLGAIVQPVDERLTPREIGAVLRDSRARAAIVHRVLWPALDAVRADLPDLSQLLGIDVHDAEGVESFAGWAVSPAPAVTASVSADDVAELMYTSGTTGVSKAVMRSHANVRAASRNSIRGFGYVQRDTIAIVMPLSHSSALNSQMMPLLELGGTIVLIDAFEPVALTATIRSERVSCLRAVPTMLRLLLAVPGFNERDLPALRLLLNSSAPIDPQAYLALKDRFPSIQVLNSYGLTEASTCTVLPDLMASRRPDSIGHAIAGVEMQVVDENGNPLPDNVEGEICVRGPHVFVGYRNLDETARRVDGDGWLRTSDLGHRDDEGYFYLHGRRDDLINCGGHKVRPLEVENCILEMGEVAEVAVGGAPHRLLGEVVKAFVIPRDGIQLDPKAVRRHCTRRLPSHKVPFHVVLVSQLPKNSVGKVVRRHLGSPETQLVAAS